MKYFTSIIRHVKPLFFMPLGLLLIACGSINGYVDDDGIYGGNQSARIASETQDQTQAQNSNTAFYKNYFREELVALEGEVVENDVFTDVDQYSSDNAETEISDNIRYTEQGRGAWGDQPGTVEVNIYHNNWGWNNWGWNNWGWNNFGWNNWGWNNWGWNGPWGRPWRYGPNFGRGFYGGYGFYCPPHLRSNYGYYGDRYAFNGRRNNFASGRRAFTRNNARRIASRANSNRVSRSRVPNTSARTRVNNSRNSGRINRDNSRSRISRGTTKPVNRVRSMSKPSRTRTRSINRSSSSRRYSAPSRSRARSSSGVSRSRSSSIRRRN